MIDWSDPNSMVSKYFSVREMLWLPKWNRLASEQNPDDHLTDSVKSNLVALCEIMDEVREYLGTPLSVHSGFRPPAYSVLVGGFATDVHTRGLAIDFDPNPELTIQDAKDLLEPCLEHLGIRMERGTKTWIHLDTHPPGPSGRYFTA